MKRISLLFSAFSFASAGITSVLSFDSLPVLAQTSGCGSGKSWYLTRVATPASAQQFRVACGEHDACYDTYGKSKQECDKAFHSRMLGICARDHNTILGRPLRVACNGRADAFYTAVLEYGQDSYNKAQASAKAGDGLYKIGNNPPIYHLYGNGRSACWVRTSQGVEQRGGWGSVKVVGGSLPDLVRGRVYKDRC
jgi:hypothetical protein